MRTMSVRDARANFSELLGSVYYTNNPIVVEKKGKPYAVVISPRQYERLKLEEERDWMLIDNLRAKNADKDPDEVYKEVTKIVEEVRQEMYEKEQKKTSSSSR